MGRMKSESMLKQIVFGVVCALVLWLFSGCGILEGPPPISPDIPERADSQKTAPPKPVFGGEIVLALSSLEEFNPLLVRSRDAMNFLSLIYESPVAYSGRMRPEPRLAERWTVEEEGTLWLFHIRRDVLWHDGEVFTGEDVLFTFEGLMSGHVDSYYAQPLAGNENILEYGLYQGDPYTFFIRLETPSAFVPDWMTFPVVSRRHYRSLEALIEQRREPGQPMVGTGPYRWAGREEETGDFLLTVNENWRDRPAYIQSIRARLYENNEQARSAVIAGQADVVDTGAVYANAFLDQELRLTRIPTGHLEFLAVNHQHPLLQESVVRRALTLAIDRREIVSRVLLNNGETVDVPVPPASWLYNSSFRIYDYDRDQAAALLYSVGLYDQNGDGYLDLQDGDRILPMELTLLTNGDNDLRRETLRLIVRYLEDIGLRIKTEILPWAELTERMQAGTYDLILTGYALDYAHDLTFAFYSGRPFDENGNFFRYGSEELDEILTSAAQAYDEEEQLLLYQDLQRYFVREMPIISLYFRTHSLLTSARIHGIERPLDIQIYQNIHDWYIYEGLVD